jgi:FAD/FMN-containing dehydrogenase
VPTAPTPAADLVPRLRAALDGRLIAPDDADYDRIRTVFPGNFDRRPAAIVRPADDADVARVVTLAAESGVSLAVRSGGHSPAGHSGVEGGLVLDLRSMNDVRIDAGARTAWAEAGATAGQYTAAAGAYGLATGFGDTGSVGLGGITLAGGAGFLSRKYGLTVDEVLAADIVTADGQRLRVDADNHPDLFWAIRGGGGNFGVATRFQYRLREVGEFTGGMLILPASADVIDGFVAAADAAPDELSTIMMTMVAPPMPFLPPEVHGKLVVVGLLAYAGLNEAAERTLAPFRALATPLADMVKPMPYHDMFEPEPEGYRPVAASRSLYVDTVDEAFAATALEQLQASTAQVSAVQLRVLGGAIGRVPADATAYAHRHRKVMVNVAAMYQQPEEAAEHEAWVGKLAEALGQGPGVYPGFLGDEGPDRVREAYPGATWDRLVAIKRQYDPANLFRHNHNIPVG